MGERNCALQSKAYAELKDAYTNRFKAAEAFKANGGRVIGTYGSDVPDEILLAAQLFPLRVTSDVFDGTEDISEQYVGNTTTIHGSQITRLINGTYAELCQNVVASNSCAAIGATYELLHGLGRVFKELKVVPLTFLDYANTRYLYNQNRNVKINERFKKTVEAWTGTAIREQELRDAIDICNEDRRAMREFDSLRNGEVSRVTGTEALVVIGSSMFMDKKRHAELVRELIEEAKDWPVIDAPRVIVYGSDHEYTDLYEVMEDAGLQPVFEDQNFGARHYDMDVNTDLPSIKAITGRYMNRMHASSSSYVQERVDQMKDFIATYKPAAVLFYMNDRDETISWDYPSQKVVLDEMGIPYQIYYNQKFPIKDKEALKAKFAELAAAAKGAK